MKIAYLIQAHDNYKHLQRLIHALDDGACRFYIHIDKKAAMPAIKGNNVLFIQERINVHWAGFSQVKATIKLMEAAAKDNNDYYALISGVDYPVKPNYYLENLLQAGGEYIDITEGYGRYFPKSRYCFYYFTDYYNRREKELRKTRFFLWLQQVLRKLHIRKNISYKIYHGSSWFVLSKACVQYILTAVQNDKRLIRFFKTALSPDEAFFQTIIGNSPFLKTAKPFLTYADWDCSPGPAVLSEKHLMVLKDEPYKFFARKFNDASASVISLIEKELRSGLVVNPDVTA